MCIVNVRGYSNIDGESQIGRMRNNGSKTVAQLEQSWLHVISRSCGNFMAVKFIFKQEQQNGIK